MDKIYEALKINSNKEGDHVALTTKGMDVSIENQLLGKAQNLSSTGLIKIDKTNGLLPSSFTNSNPGYDSLKSWFCKSNEIDGFTFGVSTLTEPLDNQRGVSEYIHFITGQISSDFPCYLIDLKELSVFKASNAELKNKIDRDEKFEEISIDSFNVISSYKVFDNEYESNIDLVNKFLSLIIDCKKEHKHVYVCYDIKNYDKFIYLLNLALHFLPKKLANTVSFITMYGNGESTVYDIVGIPTLDDDIVEKLINVNDPHIQVFKMDLEEEISVINPLIHKGEVSSLQNYLANEKSSKESFENFVFSINLYNEIHCERISYDGEHTSLFLEKIEDKLNFIKKNYDFFQNNDSAFRIFDNLSISSIDFRSIFNFSGEHFDKVASILTILSELHSKTNDPKIKNFIYTFVYNLVFNFSADEDEQQVYFRNDVLREFLTNKDFSSLLNDFLLNLLSLPQQEANISNTLNGLSMKNRQDYAANIQCFYDIYLNIILNNYSRNSLYKTKAVDFLIKHDGNYKEKIILLFSSELDFSCKFEILVSFIVKEKHHYDILKGDVLSYLTSKDLLKEAVLCLDKIHETDDIINIKFKEDLYNKYLGFNIISNYKELSECIDRLFLLEENKSLFDQLKQVLINNLSSNFDIASIQNIPLDSSEFDGKTLNRIKDLFKNENTSEMLGKIVEGIDKKFTQYEEAIASKNNINELVSFRTDYLRSIFLSLDEKKARKIIRNDPYAWAAIEENQLADEYAQSGEVFEQFVNKFFDIYFNPEIPPSVPSPNEILERRRELSLKIINSQDSTRTTLINLAYATRDIIEAIAFGVATFGICLGIGEIFAATYFNGSYRIMRIILSIFAAAFSGVLTLVHTKNRDSYKMKYSYLLFSGLESLLMIFLLIGIFIIFCFTMGGK